jgi:uncharacterized Zn-binding protein involved in type VI secretion
MATPINSESLPRFSYNLLGQRRSTYGCHGNVFRTQLSLWQTTTTLLTSPIPLESQMSLKIITVGDKTDHGGTVISGSSNHDIKGKAIARLGDKVDCPLPYPSGKPHGVNKIITAHNTLTVDGVPVAVEGCTTECGCKLIGSVPATVG